MVHELVIALQSQPEAAGFILRGIKGIFVAIGSVIAAIICAVILLQIMKPGADIR